jgi:hypothetical protein
MLQPNHDLKMTIDRALSLVNPAVVSIHSSRMVSRLMGYAPLQADGFKGGVDSVASFGDWT